MLGERVTMTIILGVATLIVTWMLAIPLGVFSAVKQYSLGDQLITTLSFVGLGMPGFLLALLILYFAITVLNIEASGLFSQQYADAPWSWGRVGGFGESPLDPGYHQRHYRRGRPDANHAGQSSRYAGAAVRGGSPGARAENRTVIWKHAVRIAINPLIVILGSEALPGIIGGTGLVSVVLNLPTIFPLYIDALRKLDMYMAGTCIILITFLVLVGNLLADILLAWSDPRIRLE